MKHPVFFGLVFLLFYPCNTYSAQLDKYDGFGDSRQTRPEVIVVPKQVPSTINHIQMENLSLKKENLLLQNRLKAAERKVKKLETIQSELDTIKRKDAYSAELLIKRYGIYRQFDNTVKTEPLEMMKTRMMKLSEQLKRTPDRDSDQMSYYLNLIRILNDNIRAKVNANAE